MPDYQTRLILGVLIPLISFVILALFGPRLGKPKASWVALAAIGLSCLLSTSVLIGWLGCDEGQRQLLTEGAARFHWSDLGTIPLDVGVKLDSLTVIMFFMVTFIAFWIHFFSIGYMAGHSDEVDGTSKYHRFFAYLSLFCFSMLGLVVSSSLLFLFFFWELVGLCSYLLIGFYFDKKYASNAAMKAFITNRVGDLGFIVGLMMVAAFLGTLDLEQSARVFAAQFEHQTGIFDPTKGFSLFGFHLSGMAVATLMGIGLFCGAMGKSAQFPLHVWLPDAMAGPTPVSALIHAATMVAAGVYLVARIFRLLTPDAQFFIAVIGCITLTITALIAIVQTDIKKVLAYSTLSQLGYMIFGLGVGAWVAALFHLMTHAFFKAMLFLGSGQVIEGCHHEQDMRKMGGLRKKMPVTCWTFFLGVLAIAGFGWPWEIGHSKFGLGGFFSKDEILAVAYDRTYNIGSEHAAGDGHAKSNLQGPAGNDDSASHPIRLASAEHSTFGILNSTLVAAADAPGHPAAAGQDAHAAGDHATGTPEKLKIASTLRRLPKWMFYLPIFIAYITPFYMMRAWWMTFCGKPRDHHVYDHAHESKMMYIPLVVLAVGTVACSYNWFGTFRPMFVDAAKVATNAPAVVAIDGEAHDLKEAADGVMMTLDHHAAVPAHDWLKYYVGFSWLIGMGIAFLIYRNGLETAAKIKRAPLFSAAHTALERKLFFDDIYDNVLVGGTVVIAWVCKFIDKYFVDGIANGLAFATKATAFFSGRQLDMKVREGDLGLVDAVYNGIIGQGAMNVAMAIRRPQSGRIRTYIAFAAGSAALVLFIILFREQIADSWHWLTAGRSATAATP